MLFRSTTYTTEPGWQTYTWNISAGGTINSGIGTNSVNVTWNTPGLWSINVNYSLGTGCAAQTPTSHSVKVNQSTPPSITPSQNPVCESFSAVYTTQPGMSAYTWTVSPGGTINSGLGTNSINVTWNTTTTQTVKANFTNTHNCTAPAPTVDTVNINPLPITTINGNLTVCQDFPTLYAYQTSVIDPLATYNWQIIAGNGTITPSIDRKSVV